MDRVFSVLDDLCRGRATPFQSTGGMTGHLPHLTPQVLDYPTPNIVQKNRNFLKEYWILRNILLPFNRIRIWFSNILLPLKGSRTGVVKLLLQQNFNRIFRFAFLLHFKSCWDSLLIENRHYMKGK